MGNIHGFEFKIVQFQYPLETTIGQSIYVYVQYRCQSSAMNQINLASEVKPWDSILRKSKSTIISNLGSYGINEYSISAICEPTDIDVLLWGLIDISEFYNLYKQKQVITAGIYYESYIISTEKIKRFMHYIARINFTPDLNHPFLLFKRDLNLSDNIYAQSDVCYLKPLNKKANEAIVNNIEKMLSINLRDKLWPIYLKKKALGII